MTQLKDALIFFSKRSQPFPKTYETIWNHYSHRSSMQKIRALLLDYTKEESVLGSLLGRFFTGHWNRHHVSPVSTILKANYMTVDDLLSDLQGIKRKQGGSLDNRVEFITLQLNKDPLFNLKSADISSNSPRHPE